MANSEPFDIQDDSDLKDAVRGETQYNDNELSEADLDRIIKSAKRVLALRAEVTQFYNDRGIAVALQGITSAKAKGAVENSPVVVDEVAGNNVRFRTSDDSDIQLQQYEMMTEKGLAQSDVTDAGVQGIHLTRTWLTDSSSGEY